MVRSLVFLTVLALGTQGAFAAVETGSSTRVKSKSFNKKFEVNTEITDAELRASAGSRSKYSVKVNATYYGGAVADPFSKTQPIRNKSPRPALTSLSGSVSARYRLNKREALSFGTGISAISPFHEFKEVEFKSPFLSWGIFKKHKNLQYRTSASVSITTEPYYIANGQFSTFSFSQGGKYQMGESKLYLGADYSVNYFAFSRDYRESDNPYSAQYRMAVYPKASYRFNDSWNLSSSVAFATKNYRSEADKSILERDRVTGRLGMGYSFSRTIYIYPYLDFLVGDFEWKTTSVSVATTFSGF